MLKTVYWIKMLINHVLVDLIIVLSSIFSFALPVVLNAAVSFNPKVILHSKIDQMILVSLFIVYSFAREGAF
jgi:hypothetical protein